MRSVIALIFLPIFISTNVWGASIQLTPVSLREIAIGNGLTVLAAAVRVHKAKENVNLSRTRLLPSINLGVLVSSAANPAFILSSVEYLLPFLIPSRWFDLAQAKHLAKAEREAFLVTELNLLASLYSIYYTVQNDYATRDMLAEELNDTITIEALVARNVEDGTASEMSLNLAKSQTSLAFSQLAKIDELIVQETAELRKALNLTLDTQFTIVPHNPPAASLETMSMQEAADFVLQTAPEARQIRYLLKSAESEEWAKIFGFISGVSAGSINGGIGVGGPTSYESSAAFKDVTGRGMFNFSFEYFPNLSLSNHNQNEIKVRYAELRTESNRLVESALGKLKFVLERKRELDRAEALLNQVFDADKLRYAAGEITLEELIQSQGRVRQARLEALKVKTDLNLLRVTAHRMTVGDEFAQVKGCEELPRILKKDRKWRWFWEDDPELNICDPEAVTLRFGNIPK